MDVSIFILCPLNWVGVCLNESLNKIRPAFLCEGAQDWTKDKKNRPIQQEDEYRLQLELNRCLKKDTAIAGTDSDLFDSRTTKTVSSRGWNKMLQLLNIIIIYLLFVYLNSDGSLFLASDTK